MNGMKNRDILISERLRSVEGMGRLYENELMMIARTYEEGIHADTSVIEKFLAINAPMLIVGSGGSFSAAKAIEYQCTRIGMMAKAITPLQLEEHQNVIYSSKVLLLTARGNNHDIINAFRYCDKLEAEGILCICFSTKSAIRREFRPNGHLLLWENDMSFGKDGYLSVNSLIAMVVIMAKAVYHYSKEEYFHLTEANPFVVTDKLLKKYEGMQQLQKDSMIILHGGATTQVAVDMESKFSETALGNIQLVDFRNFAHGRHYWMAERGENTGIIAFVDAEQRELADKTLRLIPDGIPVDMIMTEDTGFLGILRLYLEMFCIVHSAGKRIGVNPGKPKVPDYGRKLYHINFKYHNQNIIKQMDRSVSLRAAYRKNGNCTISCGMFEEYVKGARKAVEDLRKRRFKCLVFDYDGTLHWKEESDTEWQIFEILNQLLSQGIKIAIATGRGKSVRIEMKNRIEPQYRKNVGIGYYNGAVCGFLDNDKIPCINEEIMPQLEMLYDTMKEETVCKTFISGWEKPKPQQWSLGLESRQGKENVSKILQEMVHCEENLKMAFSSHSMDIMERSVVKQNVVYFMRERIENLGIDDCLYIGDAGCLGGNDFDMLMLGGLSVDRVSKNRENCHNLAPLGFRQLEATLYYLKHMKAEEDGAIRMMLTEKKV